jgi:DNA-binding GntR family transcriptional regulator
MYTIMSTRGGPPLSAERTAYEYLQGEILSGRIPGGSCVRQEEIARRLSLSRIPIRDAIRHLAAEGLLTIENNRRVIVTLLEANDLAELYQMREVLEGLAARRAVVRLSDADIDHLTWLAERMRQNEEAGDRWLPIHDEFHEFLFRKSGLPRLARELSRLRANLQPQIRMLIAQNGVAELRGSNHMDLVKEIKFRDPERAEKALRNHIRQAAHDIIGAVNSSLKVRSSSSAAGQKQSEPTQKVRRRGSLQRHPKSLVTA